MRPERAIKNVIMKKERKNLKKLALILAVATSLMLVFTVSAFAAQPFDRSTGDYSATTNPAQNVPHNAPGVDVGPVAGTSTNVTRIHSNYADNTNACAACHATHTAVGKDLLQWDGETETCMACHDGTAGVATYDVQSGHIGASTTALTNGGLFPAATDTSGSASIHDVFSGLEKLSSAPGGNYAETTGSWAGDFSCVSCHSPHDNGGNFRLLDPNVNNWGINHKLGDWPADSTGQPDLKKPPTAAVAMVDISANHDKTKWGVILPGSGSTTDQTVNSNNSTLAYLLNGPYPISIKVFTASNATGAFKKFTTAIEGDHTVFNVSTADAATISDKLYVAAVPALKVKGNIADYLQETEKVTYVSGFSDFCGACHTDYNTSIYKESGTADAPNLVAPTQGSDPASRNPLWVPDPTDPTKWVAYNVPGHAVDAPTGIYTDAYRHTVGFSTDGHGGDVVGLKFEERDLYQAPKDSVTGGPKGTPTLVNDVKFMSCLTCHVAHGTDAAYMNAYGSALDTANGTHYYPVYNSTTQTYSGGEVFDTTNTTSTTYGTGINSRGSNLKRMPNMGACEACHDKSGGALGYNITTNAY